MNKTLNKRSTDTVTSQKMLHNLYILLSQSEVVLHSNLLNLGGKTKNILGNGWRIQVMYYVATFRGNILLQNTKLIIFKEIEDEMAQNFDVNRVQI